tara:strand:+ start:21 stop:953 length:933 start_codon:yes stop_codon:yes gene_type:complete
MINMANQTLEQIVYADALTTSNVGPFGKGQSVLEQTLRDFIQLQSTQIAIGTQIVGVRTVNWITFKWYTGAQGTFTYPLDDNAVVDPTEIGTANYEVILRKGQGRVVFLDSVELRGETWENMSRQQLAIIQARADSIDNKILTDLLAGAGQTQAATAVWGSATADEEKDVLDAMDLIFANGRVSGNEPMAMVVPASVRSVLMNTQLYGNVVESLEEHLRRVASLRIYYTRDYGATGAISTSAILMIPGAETAEFFQYNGNGFMETEMTRVEGMGYSWLLTSYYGMVIHQHQDGAASGTSNRIAKITGVIA